MKISYKPRLSGLCSIYGAKHRNDVGELFSVIDNGFIPNKRLEEAIRLARDIEKNGASHGY